MKKKIIGILCTLFSVLVAIGILCGRYISNERKNDENNYFLASQSIAYELNEYIKTGDESDFSLIAVEIMNMSDMTDMAKNSVSRENATVLANLAGVLSYDTDILSSEAERLKAAFELIGENKDTDYAYAQIKTALKNCGH